MFTPPTPSDLTANVTGFRDALPDLTPLDNLVTSLTAAEAVLFTAFPAATTADYVAWIAIVKCAAQPGQPGHTALSMRMRLLPQTCAPPPRLPTCELCAPACGSFLSRCCTAGLLSTGLWAPAF